MADQSIHCPNCGKAYRWQTKIAGKRVRCVCTQKFRVPMLPTGTPEPEAPPPEAPPEAFPEAFPETPAKAPREAAPDASPQSLDPPQAPNAPEPDPYELDLPDDDAPAPPPPLSIATGAAAGGFSGRTSGGSSGGDSGGGKCPSCNSPLRPGAVICLNCGFNTAQGAKIKTVVQQGAAEERPAPAAPDDDKADAASSSSRFAQRRAYDEEVAVDVARHHHFQQKTLPLAMIGFGLALLFFNALVMAPQSYQAAGWFGFATVSRIEVAIVYLLGSAILLVVQLPCLLVGLVLSAKLFGSGFGELLSVLKKLIALALLAGSFYSLIDLGVNILLGGIGGVAWMFTLSVSFAFFWAVIVKLFDELEIAEVLILFFAMLIAPTFILAGIALFF